MGEYKVVLTDDHAIFRAGLKSLIDKDPSFKVVGEASNGEALMELLKKVKCDVVILDLSMPLMDGIASLKEIRKVNKNIKTLVLTMQKDHEHFKHAMKNGACGYMLKDDAYEELLMALKLIVRGKKFISPSVNTLVTERFVRSLEEDDTPSLEILTPKELGVLKLIAQGLANKAIARKLKVSVRTVETHRLHLSDKLGIKNTAGLVKLAISKGLI